MAGEARDRQHGIPSKVSAVGDESFQQIDINTNSSWIVVRTIKSFYFITFWRRRKKDDDQMDESTSSGTANSGGNRRNDNIDRWPS